MNNPIRRAPDAPVNLRQLRAFVAVARAGRVTQAATQLLRAQSVVTRAVHKLESSLGVPLFERRTQGVELTVYGRTLAVRAERAAGELGAALPEMRALYGRDLPSPTAPVFSMQTSHRHLQAFVLLTELHHMGEVARRLAISQPAVSAAVRELEGGLRVPLFARTPAGLFPTPAARVLVRRVRLALAELRHAAEELAALDGIEAGEARIGVLPLSRTAIVVPRAIARLTERHPGVRIILRDGAFDTQEEALRSGQLDFIIGALRDFAPDSELMGEALFDDRLHLIVRHAHPLARVRRLTMSRLAAYPWILNRASTPGRNRLEAALKQRGWYLPPIAVETGSLAMTRALLLESDFITALSPDQFEHEVRAGLLKVLPMEFPETVRPIGIIRRRGSVLAPSAARLIEALREIVHPAST